MSYHIEKNRKIKEQNEQNKNHRQGPERNANAEWQTNEQDG
jgi:hypothetical protein